MVNNSLEWKLYETITGTTQIELPTTWNELLIFVRIGNSDERSITQHILKSMLGTSGNRFCIGSETNGARIVIKNNKINMKEANWGEVSGVASSTTTTIYYK